MRILISGGGGVLSNELCNTDSIHEIIALPHTHMSVDLFYEVERATRINRPDVFIHCGAMTYPMKEHYDDPNKSINSNIIGTANVAMVCNMYKVKPVYISTDYVYEGTFLKGSYYENDYIAPVDNYGWSKLGGECAINMVKNHLILRCCFSERPFRHPKAFTNLYKSYMYVDEIAPIIWKLIDKDCKGTYNVGGKKQSVYDFAKESNPNVLPICRSEIDEVIPFNTSMNTSKLTKELND
jgi:dTDP-4-dehydrorhamnose reductase